MNKRDTRLRKERDSALMTAYEEVILRHGESAPYILKKRLYQETIEKPTHSFFVGSQTVQYAVLRAKKGVFKNERDMAIYKVFQKLQFEYDNMQLLDLYEMVANHPAPKFYISAESCGNIIDRMLKNKDE